MANYANYYYLAAAAAATAIAGILHLISFSNLIGRNPTTGIFFLVAGMAQLFWTIPMVRKWGKDLVLYRNRWYNSVDHIVFYHKSSKSNYNSGITN
jgi:hypothetical protein